MKKTLNNSPEKWLATQINSFVSTSAANTLHLPSNEKAFDSPLIGFSNGADPIYDEFVSHIGNFYLKPADIFLKTFPELSHVADKNLTIITWILPSTQHTRQDQAQSRKRPCHRWVNVRYYGEAFNEALRRYVVSILSKAGIPAVAPILSSVFSRVDQGPYAPCSNWSERHAAYAAGLGTFGLCDGLITPVGKAVRIGSVIAPIAISPNDRPYTDHHAYCLFYSHGICGKCIPRCPVNAISESGHDKKRCMQYTEYKINSYIRDTYGFSTYACGLCQAGVPCTSHIPQPDEG